MFADTAYVFDDQTRFELRKVRATFNTTTGAQGRRDERRPRPLQHARADARRLRQRRHRDERREAAHVAARASTSRRRTRCRATRRFTLVEPGRNVSGIGFRADPQLTRCPVLQNLGGQGSFTLPGAMRAASRISLRRRCCAGAACARERTDRPGAERPLSVRASTTCRRRTQHGEAAQRAVQLVHRRRRRRALPGAAASSCKSDSLEAYGDEGRVLLHRPRGLYRAAAHAEVGLPHVLPARGAPPRDVNVDATLPAARPSWARSSSSGARFPRSAQQHATAIGRPTITIIEKDSRGTAAAARDRHRQQRLDVG